MLNRAAPLPLKSALICTFYLLIVDVSIAQENPAASQVQEIVDQAWDFALSSNDSALVLAQNALELSQQNDYPLGEVLARESMGLYHEMITGDIDIASEQYFKAIEVCETHQLDYISSVYHSLGVMFHTSDNYENAMRYYKLALEASEEKGDSILIKKCLINLGSIHSSLQDFEKAEQFMAQSLEIPYQKEMDYTTYANLGNLYVKQEKFDQAIDILLKATEENPDNPDSDVNLYFLLNAKTKAQDSTDMKIALKRAKKAVISGNHGIRDQSLLLRHIADYLAFTGNYEDALYYRDKYVEVYEEIKEKQRDQIVLDMETKYETEKKDSQLKVLQLEAEKKEQQMQLYFFLAIAGLMIAGLVGFFLYKNREKNKLLTQQKTELEKNVDEINLLLNEIHHRVKNNLQVITSMLNIQQRSISDKNVVDAIQECKNRIKSMVLIHQSFYQDKNLNEINTREYVQNLVNQLFESYRTDKQKVELETKVQDIYLNIDTLIPLGLIINELVSNTLKHAFNEHENGKLSISLEKIADKFQLEISDNGNGLEDISVLEKSNSFGFKMINAFVKKIHGQLNLLNTEGTTFQIQFAA